MWGLGFGHLKGWVLGGLGVRGLGCKGFGVGGFGPLV